MNNDLFERLLHEEESATLDFKKEQYRFAKASDEDKSELLKDILGFANAWCRSEAYILIGVEEVRGERANVVGIPAVNHLPDHSLQQFVNSRTNQPVHFHYEAFGFEGKQVGIICIDEQIRPIYLKRDYGKLSREKVYVRRGSSTDPSQPASIEEIAQMRVGSGQLAAKLLVEFAHVELDDTIGTTTSWDAEFCEMPAMKTIPDLVCHQRRGPINSDLIDIQFDPMNRPNANFYRELAEFEFVRRLFRPIRLAVENVSKVAARNVRVELTVPTNIGVVVLQGSKLPDRPERRSDFLNNALLHDLPGRLHRTPGKVSIDKNDERHRIEIDFGDLQPGRRVWSDVFYIGKGASGNLSLCGLAFADNLPQPMDFALTASVTVTNTAMTVEDLCSIPEASPGSAY